MLDLTSWRADDPLPPIVRPPVLLYPPGPSYRPPELYGDQPDPEGPLKLRPTFQRWVDRLLKAIDEGPTHRAELERRTKMTPWMMGVALGLARRNGLVTNVAPRTERSGRAGWVWGRPRAE